MKRGARGSVLLKVFSLVFAGALVFGIIVYLSSTENRDGIFADLSASFSDSTMAEKIESIKTALSEVKKVYRENRDQAIKKMKEIKTFLADMLESTDEKRDHLKSLISKADDVMKTLGDKSSEAENVIDEFSKSMEILVDDATDKFDDSQE